MTTQLNPRAICQSVKDETLLLQYNPNNTQAFVPKKLLLNINYWVKRFTQAVNGN